MPGPSLDINVRRDNGRILLTVRGEIDLMTVPTLEAALEGAAAEPVGEIRVDLGKVDFMDSTGLRALVTIHHALDHPRRRLVIVSPSGPARRTLEISGLLSVLNVAD